MHINMSKEGAKKMEPSTSQWCPVTGPEAMCKNRNTGGFFTAKVTDHWDGEPK